MSSLYYSDLCRLCLVKNRDLIPIFDGEGYMRRIVLKISTCLPLKVSREDHLPKNVCADCVCRIENQFQFWNTTLNSEKQLLDWLRSTPTTVDSAPLPQFSEIEIKPVELTLDSDIKSLSALDGSDEETSSDDSDRVMNERELEAVSFANVTLSCGQTTSTAGTTVTEPACTLPVHSSMQPLEPAKEYRCAAPGCARLFWQMEEFEQHQLQHEVADRLGRQYRCLQCLSSFATLLEMETHEAQQHPALGDDKTSDDASITGRHRVRYQHTCAVCGTAYATMDALTEHLQTHSRQRATTADRKPLHCDVCQKVFTEASQLRSHMVSHSSERPYRCLLCDKSFKRKAILVKHGKTHSGVKEHACCYCSYATVHKTNLEYHKMRRHSQAFEFTCDICGKRFKAPGDLKSHIVTHEERRFKCSDCDKAFHFKHLLVAHQRTHNPHRYRLQCELCGKSYSQKSSLTDHISRFHLGHTYKCEICAKVVTTPESLTIHRRRHTGEKPFACEVCRKAFVSKKMLSVHRLVHSGDKPHRCGQCGKCFTQRSTLVVHTRYHSGVRPYACDACPKSFVTRTLLTAHAKTHLPVTYQAQQHRPVQ